MRVTPYPVNPYVRDISRSAARTGATVDLTSAVNSPPSAKRLSGPRPNPETGALQDVLTPEESRLIADLFPRQGTDVKVGHGYTHAGRTMPGSIPGIRLDLKG